MIKSIKDYFFFRLDKENWWSSAIGFHKCGDVSLMMVFHWSVYMRVGEVRSLLGVRFGSNSV